MSIVDIVIIALVALFIMLGVWRGVRRSALGFGAFLVAAIIAFFLAKPVTEALLGAEGIRGFVLGNDGWSLYLWIKKGFATFGEGEVIPSEYLTEHFFKPILDKVINNFSGYTAQFTPEDGLAVYCAFLMFSSIVGVAVFIVARLLLCIPTMILKSYIYGKQTSTSRVFGGIVGAVRGFVMSIVLTVIITTMGGLTFVGGFSKVEKEYEQSVIAKTVYTWSYGIRNSMYLPDAEMFARLVDKSGLTVDSGEAPPDQSLYGDRLEIYIYLNNLNYITGTPYSYDDVTGNLTFDDTDCTKIDPSAYEGTGIDAALRAIMAYNEQAATSIGQGSLDDKDSGTLLRYKEALWEGSPSVYTILIQQSLLTNAQNYVSKIAELKKTVNADNIDNYNHQLELLHATIVTELNAIKSLYGELATVFGPLTFDIPEAVVLTLDPPVEG